MAGTPHLLAQPSTHPESADSGRQAYGGGGGRAPSVRPERKMFEHETGPRTPADLLPPTGKICFFPDCERGCRRGHKNCMASDQSSPSAKAAWLIRFEHGLEPLPEPPMSEYLPMWKCCHKQAPTPCDNLVPTNSNVYLGDGS